MTVFVVMLGPEEPPVTMAYRLDLDRPTGRAAWRVARRQLAQVAAGLEAGSDVTPHETRKAVKRLRALLRLLAPVEAGRRHRRLDRDLRDVGRSLAGARDSEVMQATWTRIAAAARLDADLANSGRKALKVAGRAPPAAAADRLEAIEVGFRRLRKRALTNDDLVSAATRTYRLARRLRRHARTEATTEAFHEWRKEVQRHWRHMQLLSGLWPDEMAARVALARELSELIGDEHDLAVLASWLTSPACPPEITPERQRLSALIEREQSKLRARALAGGERLFAERPKGFRKRLRIYAATRDHHRPADVAASRHKRRNAPLPLARNGHHV